MIHFWLGPLLLVSLHCSNKNTMAGWLKQQTFILLVLEAQKGVLPYHVPAIPHQLPGTLVGDGLLSNSELSGVQPLHSNIRRCFWEIVFLELEHWLALYLFDLNCFSAHSSQLLSPFQGGGMLRLRGDSAVPGPRSSQYLRASRLQ